MSDDSSRPQPRYALGGISAGDVVLVLSALAVLAAVVAPWITYSRFVDRVDQALAVVEQTRLAVLEHREREGSWPVRAAPGQVPAALRAHLPRGLGFEGDGYTLQVERWSAVEGPPREPVVAPDQVLPPADSAVSRIPRVVALSGLRVHASEPALLAALLAAYDPAESFVRDTTWTLVFPRRASPWDETARAPEG